MADRLRSRRPQPTTALTAAARILTATRVDAPKKQPWHTQAWAYRDTTPEVRFAELWLSNSMSKARLVAAQRTSPDKDPEPLEDTHPASELVASLAGGTGGQSQMLRQFAQHLLTPGICYLVGEPGAATKYRVVSSDQLQIGSFGYRIKDTDYGGFRDLPAGTLVSEIMRPHPQFSWLPDSPVQGVLPILRELSLLSQHVDASATSRLAGAGLLLLDSNMEFPQGWAKWIDEFLETITAPITDRGSAAAVAPFPVKVPVPKGQSVKDMAHHLMFSTPFDERTDELTERVIARLATGLDLPTAMLRGDMNENHWGKWQTAEEGLTIHIEPNLELVADGLTVGFLRPAMQAIGDGAGTRSIIDSNGVSSVVTEPELDGEWRDIIVWYDVSNLQVRPDRSEDVVTAFDRWEADGDDLRRETGLSDANAPTGPAFERRVWISMLEGDTPELRVLAMEKLGLIQPGEVKITKAPVPGAQPPAPEPPATPGNRDLPDTQDDEPADDATPPAMAASAAPAALVAACDGLVHRALERCGNRLRSRVRDKGDPALDQPPTLMHTVCNAGRVVDAGSLLAGAWDRVPEVAAQLGEDPDQLTAALDDYCRRLIRSRQVHSWGALADALAGRAELVA